MYIVHFYLHLCCCFLSSYFILIVSIIWDCFLISGWGGGSCLKVTLYHHHVMPSTRISLTLSRHPSPSSIASGRSSRLHPVSTQSCRMQVLAGRPAFARPCEEVHRSTSLMSSSLLFKQCPACLVCLTWIVFMMGGKWPYSCCFVGCCLQD